MALEDAGTAFYMPAKVIKLTSSGLVVGQRMSPEPTVRHGDCLCQDLTQTRTLVEKLAPATFHVRQLLVPPSLHIPVNFCLAKQMSVTVHDENSIAQGLARTANVHLRRLRVCVRSQVQPPYGRYRKDIAPLI